MYSSRLLAIDPSLTCSGWALFERGRGALLGVGKIRSRPPQEPLSTRLADVQDKITQLFSQLKLGGKDVLICEAPTTMKDPRAAFKVEQVRGIFEIIARARGVSVPGRINPRSVHFEIMGLKGKQLPREQIKMLATGVVQSVYGPALTALGLPDKLLKQHQDMVDAILLGSLGLTWLEAAGQAGVTADEYFEMRKPKRMSARWRVQQV